MTSHLIITAIIHLILHYVLHLISHILPCRVIKKLTTPTTDTDDTDEDRDVGGQSMYSHNTMCLTHQHWVDQVVSAGGFNVHCAQGAESSHKFNMHVASARVRHDASSNVTQTSMLHYLCEQLIFQHLSLLTEEDDGDKSSHAVRPGLHHPLGFEFNTNLCDPRFRQTFLHPQVRVTVEELILFLCQRLHLPNTFESFRQLGQAQINLGTKYVVRTVGSERAQTFWGTDDRRTVNVTARRDLLFLKGTVDGNGLCAETVCFVQVSNLPTMLNEDGVLDMVLVRWLTPHNESWERDSLRRPVCPGPFHVNNCLWKYASTINYRSDLVRADGQPTATWTRQRHLFGQTEAQQLQCWAREKRAYFGLVDINNIVDIMHMCHTFESGTADHDHDTWLQTVNLF